MADLQRILNVQPQHISYVNIEAPVGKKWDCETWDVDILVFKPENPGLSGPVEAASPHCQRKKASSLLLLSTCLETMYQAYLKKIMPAKWHLLSLDLSAHYHS